jgi:hypothetical protein
MTDVEHALHFLEQRFLIEKIGALPLDRMTRGRFEIAFAFAGDGRFFGHGLESH